MAHRLFTLICCSLWAFQGANWTHAREDFTLPQIMDFPFPSGLVTSKSGQSLAWIQNFRGARNVWVAAAPDFKGRQLTDWSADDGYTISQIVFSTDQQAIFFVRGDGANRRGELPNPSHDPEGVKQSIWMVRLDGAESRLLTEGSSPTPIPDRSGVLFLSRGQIQKISFEKDAKAEPLIQARGGASALRWSPQGNRLAYVSNRGDHSFIVVFDWTSQKLQYLDPSIDRDSDPVWSPDGTQLAFRRTPARRRAAIFEAQREGQPWSIRVHDFNSGQTHQLWNAEDGPGSNFHPVVASNQLFWSQDNFIVFPWERSGWNLLYSVPAAGGPARLLSPGSFEVEEVSWARDKRHLVFNSNQSDIDRRHIWQVAASGGPARPLTQGRDNEWNGSALAGDQLAFIRSGGQSPPQVYLRSGSSTRRLAPDTLPPDFPESHLVLPQQVVFDGADGMKIHGQLFLPSDHRPGEQHPAMLYFHGGSRRQMLLGWHYSSYYSNCYAMNQYMANQGYVVLSVNYRSGIGYGLNFREALNYGAQGASEFNDVLGAGVYLRNREDVDPTRIGLWGGSYGGYLTALGLARASDLFAAGVDVHGVHDWNPVIQNFIPSYDPLQDPNRTRLAFESSPMASLDTWRSPVLLIHGDDDRNVPFSESVHLAEDLRKRGVHFEQLIFPDEVHGFLMHRSWMKAFETAADFLERNLVRRSPGSQ